jgi:hypothetical protein
MYYCILWACAARYIMALLPDLRAHERVGLPESRGTRDVRLAYSLTFFVRTQHSLDSQPIPLELLFNVCGRWHHQADDVVRCLFHRLTGDVDDRPPMRATEAQAIM